MELIDIPEGDIDNEQKKCAKISWWILAEKEDAIQRDRTTDGREEITSLRVLRWGWQQVNGFLVDKANNHPP